MTELDPHSLLQSLDELATFARTLSKASDSGSGEAEGVPEACVERLRETVNRVNRGNLVINFNRLRDDLDYLESWLGKLAEKRPEHAAEGSTVSRGLALLRGLRAAADQLLGQDIEESADHVGQLEINRFPQESPLARDPVFIVGYRRSGTTLLSWLLDSHPRFCVVPENTVCMHFLATAQVGWGESDGTMAHLVLAQHSAERLGEKRSRFYGRMATLIDGLYGDYAKSRGKGRWVSKELFLHRSLDLLDLVFAYRARFIFIYRHGLDAAFSASKRFGARGAAPLGGGLDLKFYLDEWVETNEGVLDFSERNPGRCLPFCYETFTRDPEPSARRLFEFLQVPWHPDIFRDMREQDHDLNLGDDKIFATGGEILSNRRDRWQQWDQVLQRQMGRLANPTLVRLGYKEVS